MLYDVLIFNGDNIVEAETVIRLNAVEQGDMELLSDLLANQNANICLFPFREEDYGDLH